MTSVIVIQPMVSLVLHAVVQFSGWTGWSDFYRSF
jgi:hypothetical protein